MKIDFVKIQGQVREVLKSIGALKPGGVAADPPKDPDALDERLEGAAPTKEGMADAGAEAAAGQQAAGGGEGAPEGEGGEPDEDEGGEGSGDGDSNDAGAEEGEGRPVKKSLEDGGSDTDGFGNQDLSPEEIRSLEKSYGNGTGKAEPDELLNGGPDLEDVLASILQGFEDLNIVVQALHDEISTLKAGQTATNRKLSKAMADLQPEAHLADPPAPIPAPKAVTRVAVKALDGGPAPAVRLTPDQIFAGMKNGTLSLEAATANAREARSV